MVETITTDVWMRDGQYRADISDFIDEGDSIIGVVTAVSEMMGCEPTDIAPLADYIDPCALGTLIEETTEGISLNFEAYDRHIEVFSDGDIRIVEKLTTPAVK